MDPFSHTADIILSWLHQELLTTVSIFLGHDAPSLQNWFPCFNDNVDISTLVTEINVLLKDMLGLSDACLHLPHPDCLPVPVQTSVPLNDSVLLLLPLFLAGFLSS